MLTASVMLPDALTTDSVCVIREESEGEETVRLSASQLLMSSPLRDRPAHLHEPNLNDVYTYAAGLLQRTPPHHF